MAHAALLVKGNFTQTQFDALKSIWENLQKGRFEPLPAIQLPYESSLTIVQRSQLTGEIIVEKIS